jgi:N-acetylmuramoyl-L-alanine amidase
MTLLIYLIKTVFISGFLLGYYWLFLRNRFFHDFNRYFLLSVPALSLLVPALQFNLPAYWNQASSGSPIRLLGVGRGTLLEAVSIYSGHRPVFSWEFILYSISALISFVLLFRLYKTIRFLQLLRKNKPNLHLPEATIYFVSEKGTPFSFFKNIFWGNEMDIDSASGRQILRHEIYHVKNNHTLDILALEIVSALFWFNPLLHLIRRELQAIHEYAADSYAAAETNGYEYASLLIFKISGSPIPLTNPFFKNQIKRRIAMITKTNKNKKALLGRFMILPLIAILIGLFSFKITTRLSFAAAKAIRVVIDPGHGGLFTGAESNGIYEKNINLSIAKKIQTLSREYNVEVIMTREKDEDRAGDNLRASLEYRVALAEKKNADIFISIHTNSVTNNVPQDKYSGFDIYVPENESKFYEGSVKLASSISDYIKPDFNIAGELKQGKERIRVLDLATVPAILIECGYMDNKSDLAYLLDDKNQEKIARDILEGIRKYNLQGRVNSTGLKPNANLSRTNASETGASEMKMMNSEEQKENSNDSTAPLKKVEVEADYPGGSDAWVKYLGKTLQYPMEAISNEVQGEVMVEFVVRKDGSLTDIRAISGPKQLRAESVRVIAESGNWVPAMDQGIKVDSYKKQPIRYRLNVSK